MVFFFFFVKTDITWLNSGYEFKQQTKVEWIAVFANTTIGLCPLSVLPYRYTQMTVTVHHPSQSTSNMQMTFFDSSLILFWPIKKSIMSCSFHPLPKGLRDKENAHQLPYNTNLICPHSHTTFNSNLIYNWHTISIKKGFCQHLVPASHELRITNRSIISIIVVQMITLSTPLLEHNWNWLATCSAVTRTSPLLLMLDTQIQDSLLYQKLHAPHHHMLCCNWINTKRMRTAKGFKNCSFSWLGHTI